MKILLTSISAGSGHVQAALAVQHALNKYFPAIETKHVDIMDHVPGFFKTFYVGGYSLAANRFPRLWGQIYYGTDKEKQIGQGLMSRLQIKFCAPFFKYVADYKPDLIVTTHFLLPQILPQLVKAGFKIPVQCVVTDFFAHQFWIDPHIQRYYVAQEKTTEKLTAQGIDRAKIVVSGIPLHAKFNDPVDKAKVCRDLGLDAGAPTLLFLSGGLGFGDLVSTIKSIFRLPNKIQIITVSGKNEKLHNKLQALKAPAHMKAVHLGFVTNMQELLSVTDVVVTKAGGLTLSECLAKGNAMVFYPVIPGQEEKNCEFAEAVGAGMRARSLGDLSAILAKLLANPGKVAQMKNNAFLFAKPAAALTIAQNVAATRLSA